MAYTGYNPKGGNGINPEPADPANNASKTYNPEDPVLNAYAKSYYKNKKREKTGKSEVLRANKEIYNAVQSICVKIIDLSQSNNGKIFAQLEIKVDEINTICVVDVFEVINLKIHSIQAYKC